MIEILQMWWHIRRNGDHMIHVSRVSVPMFDPSAKGLYYKCSCGKDWSR